MTRTWVTITGAALLAVGSRSFVDFRRYSAGNRRTIFGAVPTANRGPHPGLAHETALRVSPDGLLVDLEAGLTAGSRLR
jgi:hypothetical protein